jgi:phosphoribosyl-AMP cyclohydrolase
MNSDLVAMKEQYEMDRKRRQDFMLDALDSVKAMDREFKHKRVKKYRKQICYVTGLDDGECICCLKNYTDCDMDALLINVPYDKKEFAKKLGAKYTKNTGWYIYYESQHALKLHIMFNEKKLNNKEEIALKTQVIQAEEMQEVRSTWLFDEISKPFVM